MKWSSPLSFIQNALVSSDLHLFGGALIKQIILKSATSPEISCIWFLWYGDRTVQISCVSWVTEVIPEPWYLCISIWHLSILMQVQSFRLIGLSFCQVKDKCKWTSYKNCVSIIFCKIHLLLVQTLESELCDGQSQSDLSVPCEFALIRRKMPWKNLQER